MLTRRLVSETVQSGPRGRASSKALRIGVALFLAALVLLGSAPLFRTNAQPTEYDEEIEEQKKELDQIKKDLEGKRRKAGQLRGREKSAVSELKQVEDELNTTEKYVRKLTKREQAVDKQLSATVIEVKKARASLELQTELLAWRVREIYKYGRTRSLEFLISSESFAQLLSRFRYLTFVAESDKELLEDFDTQKGRLEDSEAKLRSQLAEVASLRAETQREKSNLIKLKAKKRDTISQIQTERRSYEEAANELERTAARIQALLEELERRRKEELARRLPTPEWMAFSEFEKAKGRLNWPVAGRVAGQFGNNTHPRFGTTTFSPGIDISASYGSEIRAVAVGRVDYASWLSGLGNCVVLNHGGGYYTIYAHASELAVAVGQEVSPGQVIGRVGDSGSLKGSCLHFEIRKGKQALNPTEWLR
ncbi:MAG: peptidoglycan DD-metalloendopeptidase family protein [Candidatus Eiseniibacteriota bacterium]|nr:MAG: peptidoglycan DD-metalloendopeptidase family protein [Candidatus Eisenbacteria bacterium]